MKNNIKGFTLLSAMALFIITTGCKGKIDVPDLPENTNDNQFAVVITANTALRIDPMTFSTRVEQMKKGEILEILDKSSIQQTIAGKKEFWYKVRLTNGITGWVFGSNINIMKDSNRENVESYLSKFWEQENEELSKALHGKWWSVNSFGDYTNHCLEIYKDGKYKSYFKGASTKTEGNYNIDFSKNQIIFLGGTSFEGQLTYIRRGDIYTLFQETADGELRFKKININPESEAEDQTINKQSDNNETVRNEDEN